MHVGRRRALCHGSPHELDRGRAGQEQDRLPTPDYSNDQDDITRYVLRDMTLDEQIEFEVRMAEDEELARAVVAAMAIDDLLRQAARQDWRG